LTSARNTGVPPPGQSAAPHRVTRSGPLPRRSSIKPAIARTLLGLGMGTVLVSETWPAQHPGKAIGLMQGGWAIGYIAAAIVAITLLLRFGWRAMFFAGIAPALFTLWIRRKVDELRSGSRPGAQRVIGKATGESLVRLFRKDLVRFTLPCTPDDPSRVLVDGIVIFS
jgi:MFS family permease